ncbi:MAG: hypothetical protein J5J00_17075, partial [Deltaproteobacteria bacterium]|nr:hypothetical protein [Deltaproteobacteria bacterium]
PANCKVQLMVQGAQDSTACFAPVIVDGCKFDCAGTLNGSVVIDRCGVCGGDGSSCLECNTVDIASTQLLLDGNANRQNALIKKGLRQLLNKKNTKSNKIFVESVRSSAQSLATESWQTAYSIPQIITSCANTVFCAQVSNIAQIDKYNENAKALDSLVRSVAKRLKRQGSTKKFVSRYLKQGDLLFTESQKISDSVPRTSSQCN